MSNDLRSLLSALNDQGWEVDRTRSQQYRAKPPTAIGEIVIFSPDLDKQPRFFQNAIRDLRHNGFQWPAPDAPRAVARRSDEEPKQTTGARTLGTPPTVARALLAATQPAETEGDRLFRELKEARDYYGLCTEELADAGRSLRSAKTAHDEATTTAADARAALGRAKEAFDRAFSPD